MLTAFARFGERAATIVPTPGIEGGQTALKGPRGSTYVRCRDSGPTMCMLQASPAPRASLYLPAAILLINSSTRQLSCSFS
jgi:hypothetical protein